MGSNTFGKYFQVSTWGESHGKAIGVLVDGCPPGLDLSEEELNRALAVRRPGRNSYVSPRNESDEAEILSGCFEGRSTGSPISIIIPNRDVDSSKYDSLKSLYRPGHANYTYLAKYGIFDPRGGGRASARETACRVAAAYVAGKLLKKRGIEVLAHLKSIGGLNSAVDGEQLLDYRDEIAKSPLFVGDSASEFQMKHFLDGLLEEGDSTGGIVEVAAFGLPVGLGEPLYDKLEARIAQAMLSIPASKGVELGRGFEAAQMRGSEHNDSYVNTGNAPMLASNNCGGILGGISTGTTLISKVVFKPTSSIRKVQSSVDFEGKSRDIQVPKGSRHDPCVAIRAVPVVKAMMELLLADFLLLSLLSENCLSSDHRFNVMLQ